MKTLLLACLFLGLPSLAFAQGLGITSVNLRQYATGATAPISGPFNILVASINCNQVTATTGQPLHSAQWDDPINVGKSCLYIDPGTGPLFAKIYGALEGTLTNVAGTLESAESVRAPFFRTPLAPTSPRLVP